MRTQYTAIIEKDRGWFVAHCIEIPGTSGRGPTEEAAKTSLAEAILMVLGREPDPGAAAGDEDGGATVH